MADTDEENLSREEILLRKHKIERKELQGIERRISILCYFINKYLWSNLNNSSPYNIVSKVDLMQHFLIFFIFIYLVIFV